MCSRPIHQRICSFSATGHLELLPRRRRLGVVASSVILRVSTRMGAVIILEPLSGGWMTGNKIDKMVANNVLI